MRGYVGGEEEGGETTMGMIDGTNDITTTMKVENYGVGSQGGRDGRTPETLDRARKDCSRGRAYGWAKLIVEWV